MMRFIGSIVSRIQVHRHNWCVSIAATVQRRHSIDFQSLDGVGSRDWTKGDPPVSSIRRIVAIDCTWNRRIIFFPFSPFSFFCVYSTEHEVSYRFRVNNIIFWCKYNRQCNNHLLCDLIPHLTDTRLKITNTPWTELPNRSLTFRFVPTKGILFFLCFSRHNPFQNQLHDTFTSM